MGRIGGLISLDSEVTWREQTSRGSVGENN